MRKKNETIKGQNGRLEKMYVVQWREDEEINDYKKTKLTWIAPHIKITEMGKTSTGMGSGSDFTTSAAS